EDADLIDRNDEQQFLASADFLSSQRMPSLVSNMQAAATEVLRGKQLRDIFNSSVLHDTIMQILNMFMSMGRPRHWVEYLMPEDVRFYKSLESSGSDVSDITKLDQLMVETRTVLSSSEFGNILDLSLRNVVDRLMEDMNSQFGDGNLSSTTKASTLQTGADCGLLLTCSNHLNRPSLILLMIVSTSIFALYTPLGIMSSINLPQVHLSILNSLERDIFIIKDSCGRPPLQSCCFNAVRYIFVNPLRFVHHRFEISRSLSSSAFLQFSSLLFKPSADFDTSTISICPLDLFSFSVGLLQSFPMSRMGLWSPIATPRESFAASLMILARMFHIESASLADMASLCVETPSVTLDLNASVASPFRFFHRILNIALPTLLR
nr:peroxisome biogenesis protein 3-2-like isoform X1 [Tanacetum cinerariifolium]